MEYSTTRRFNAFSRGSLSGVDRMRFKTTTTTTAEASIEQKASVIPSIGPGFFEPISRKRRRSAPATMVQQPTTSTSQSETNRVNGRGNVAAKAAVPAAAASKKRKRNDINDNDRDNDCNRKNNDDSNSSPSSTTTKTQTDILKCLKILENYANGSNAANFLHFDAIPKLLFGVVGTHFESDPGAVTIAIKTILKYTTFCRNRDGSHRRRMTLRELFRKALRSGGTEHALQAIQRLGVAYWKNKISGGAGTTGAATTTTSNTPLVTLQLQKDTLLGCWKIVMAGIGAGLSRRLYMLLVQACLAELDEIRNMEVSALTKHFEVLLAVLGVLSEALARPELTVEDLAREHHAILTNCLALLSKACMCGVSPLEAETKGNGKGSGDNENKNEEDDGNAIPLIEDGLGILVICAQKRLLLQRDFERLVPACNACLSRFVLSRKMSGSSMEQDLIPIRVVQLIEAEDATIGLWLRETFGISAPGLIESPNRLQESLLAMQQKPYHVWEPVPPGFSSAMPGQQQQYQQEFPPPLPPGYHPPLGMAPAVSSRVPSRPSQFRSFVICDPEDTDSEEEDYYDHDEGDDY